MRGEPRFLQNVIGGLGWLAFYIRFARVLTNGAPARQGTESVKEFLVAKLKETEAALKRSLDEKGLTLRQSASDQEVISFLDSRTQVRTQLPSLYSRTYCRTKL